MTVETQVLWGLGVFAGLLLLIMLRKLLMLNWLVRSG